MIFSCQSIKLASGFRSVNVSIFELILKGHAEGDAEAEKGSCSSQREEETDQAAAATNDVVTCCHGVRLRCRETGNNPGLKRNKHIYFRKRHNIKTLAQKQLQKN